MTGAEIRYPPELKSKLNLSQNIKYAMLICDLPSKVYSLCVQINQQIQDSKLNQALIKIDEHLLGPLVKEDQVLLLNYQPPVALQVLLGLQNKYHLPEGDWGIKIVNPFLNSHVLDLGTPVDFMYGQQQPMFVEAFVKSTVPKAPVKVNSQTIFIIKKLDNEQIRTFQAENEKLKENRAREYLKRIQNQTFNFISAIRNHNTNIYTKTFNFSNIVPKDIYLGIKQVLTGTYQLITDETTDLQEGFMAMLVAIPKDSYPPEQLFEFQVSGKLKQGRIGFWSYSMEEENYLLRKKWEQIIINLTHSMKEIPQAIIDNCQACNARLPINEQDNKGIIQCKACETYNQLPISLRSF